MNNYSLKLEKEDINKNIQLLSKRLAVLVKFINHNNLNKEENCTFISLIREIVYNIEVQTDNFSSIKIQKEKMSGFSVN